MAGARPTEAHGNRGLDGIFRGHARIRVDARRDIHRKHRDIVLLGRAVRGKARTAKPAGGVEAGDGINE